MNWLTISLLAIPTTEIFHNTRHYFNLFSVSCLLPSGNVDAKKLENEEENEQESDEEMDTDDEEELEIEDEEEQEIEEED